MSALRSLEREKDIKLDVVVEAIETALLTAYRHTDGAAPHARVVLDRKTGEVMVLAQEVGDDDETYGEYAGREGDIVSGIVQQAPQRPGAPPNRTVMVKLGTRPDSLEATLPLP